MLSFPVSFIAALLLLILMARLGYTGAANRRPKALLVLIGASALLLILVGLRWTLEAKWTLFARPVVASILPALAWMCFSGLAGRNNRRRRRWHVLPVLVVLGMALAWPIWQGPVDLVLSLLYFVYGVALLRLAAKGANELDAAAFSEAPGIHRGMQLTAVALLISAGVDLFVFLDFEWYQGRHAPWAVAGSNLLMLLVVAGALVTSEQPGAGPDVAEKTNPAGQARNESPEPSEGTDDDERIVATVEQVLCDQALYRDPGLNLERLARRVLIPSKRLSAAINRIKNRNVSQWVNEYRIADAKRLLLEGEQTVTDVMLMSGFQTKSNFNREFRRVVGMSPTEYRRKNEP